MSTVSLNIGGTIFTTTKSTLTKYDGMLKAMFTSDLGLTQQADSSVFIDRDPTHFRRILNYLRDGFLPLPSSVEAILEIRQEAEYYCLDGLYVLCQNSLFPNGIPAFHKNRFWFTVGGETFSATVEEVERCGGLLKEKFEEKKEMWKSKTTKWEICTEVLFDIDRDASIFPYIIGYIQSNRPPRADQATLSKIKEEAVFFGIEALSTLCDDLLRVDAGVGFFQARNFQHPPLQVDQRVIQQQPQHLQPPQHLVLGMFRNNPQNLYNVVLPFPGQLPGGQLDQNSQNR